MTSKSEQVCKLCLGTIHDNNCKTLEANHTQILETLLLQVDIKPCEQCVVCTDCIEMLQKCFEFKKRSLQVEDCVSPFIENGTKIDLERVLQEHFNIVGNDNDIKLCRLCGDIIEDGTCKHLNQHDCSDLLDDIRNCLPELTINAVYDPLICEKCINCINEFKNFQKKCRYWNHFSEPNEYMKLDISSIFKMEPIESNEKFDDLQEADCNLEIKVDEGQRIENINNFNIKSEDEMDEISNGVCTEHIKFEDVDIKDEPSEPDVEPDSCGKTDKSSSDLCHSNKDSGIYHCTSCNYETKTKHSLLKHSTIHLDPSEKGIYTCNECDFTTHWQFDLKEHGLIHKNLSEAPLYRCKECGLKTRWRSNFRRHLSHHAKPQINKLKCTLCKFTTESMECLEKHKLKHLNISDYTTYSQVELQSHTSCDENSCKVNTNAKHCPNKITKNDLKTHMSVYKDSLGIQLYKCGLCNYETRYKRNLNDHMMGHLDPSEREIYRCNECDFTTHWKYTLKRHSLGHKDLSEIQLYRCNDCGYETKWKSYFGKHRLQHINADSSKNKTYKCHLCNFKAYSENKLQAHTFFHKNSSAKKTKDDLKIPFTFYLNSSGTRIYKCSICDYETNNKPNINRHMLVHADSSERIMYKCDVCDYTTHWKYALKRHSLMHKDLSEINIYKCKHCEFETKYKDNLVKHLQTLMHYGNRTEVNT